MGDGWETARRRDDGNDWVRIRLAGPGRVKLAEIDTSYFIGNSPGAAALTGFRADGEPVRVAAAHRPAARHPAPLPDRRRRR